jgi:hypothetical protein
VLGKEHVDTLWSAYELAVVLRYQEKYEEAEVINRRTLEARERVLGKEHVDTLSSARELAYVLRQQDTHKKAGAAP